MNEYSFKVRFELTPLPSQAQSGETREPGAYRAALQAMRQFYSVGGDFNLDEHEQQATVTWGDFTAHVRYTGGRESLMPVSDAAQPMFREENFVVRVERRDSRSA